MYLRMYIYMFWFKEPTSQTNVIAIPFRQDSRLRIDLQLNHLLITRNTDYAGPSYARNSALVYVCKCVATMFASSGRMQLVNQRMNRKPTGRTGGCVIRAWTHQPETCVYTNVCWCQDGPTCVFAKAQLPFGAIWRP